MDAKVYLIVYFCTTAYVRIHNEQCISAGHTYLDWFYKDLYGRIVFKLFSAVVAIAAAAVVMISF